MSFIQISLLPFRLARIKILKLPFLQDAGLPSIAEDLVRNINRHAEVVLEGVHAMAAGGSLTATVRISPCIHLGFSFNLVPKMRMDMDVCTCYLITQASVCCIGASHNDSLICCAFLSHPSDTTHINPTPKHREAQRGPRPGGPKAGSGGGTRASQHPRPQQVQGGDQNRIQTLMIVPILKLLEHS